MIDLRNYLEEMDVPESPAIAEIEADLARGRRALRRRRAGQAVAGSAFSVAALIAAFTVATAGTAPGRLTPVVDRPGDVSVASLVAYHGKQPKGFTVDKVPAGWFVQGDEEYSLVMAPELAKSPGPHVDPSVEPLYDFRNYRGKITVMLEHRSENGPPRPGTAVKVGDRNGTLVKSLPGMTPAGEVPPARGGDTGWELWVKQPTGVHLVVQFWQGIGMSADQMMELGAGVHVHESAKQTG